MISCASLDHGAARPFGTKSGVGFRAQADQRGFTLLEMCMVLLIIMILAGVTMPAFQSAISEQYIRNDSRQLALMVRTAMLQSTEQHRPYIIDLTATTVYLHPAGEHTEEGAPTAASEKTEDAEPESKPEDIENNLGLDAPNKLMVPDPKKANAWMAMPETTWLFRPGELCPAPKVRLSRGEAWLELNFNVLTGEVENEATYFP